jgi:DNA-binding NarL/FixJ family response regulator
MLNEEGYDVVAAVGDSAALVDAVAALAPDVVVVDVRAVFPFQRIPALWDNRRELAQTPEQAAVAERLEPDRLPGTHTTMGGTQAVVTTDPGGLRVNGTKVACQQLETTNAAIYIVDEPVPRR